MRGLLFVATLSGAALFGNGATTLTLTNFQAGAEIGTAGNWTPNQTPGSLSVLRLGTSGSGYPKTQEVLVSGSYSIYGLTVGVDKGYTGVVRMTSGSLVANGISGDSTIALGNGSWGNPAVGFFYLNEGTLSTTNSIRVGNYGDGYLIQNGGQIINTNPDGLVSGFTLGTSAGSVNATGYYCFNDGYCELGPATSSSNIGLDSPGCLYMTNTAGNPLLVVRRALQVGRKTPAPGRIHQKAGTIRVETGGSLTIGAELGTAGHGYYQLDGGVLTNQTSGFTIASKTTGSPAVTNLWQGEFVQNGGMAFFYGLTIAGSASARGRLEMNDGLSRNASTTTIGGNGAAELRLNGGLFVHSDSTKNFSVGNNSTGTGMVWQTGGALKCSGNLILATSQGSTAGWTISGGEMTNSASFYNGYQDTPTSGSAFFKIIGGAPKIRFRNYELKPAGISYFRIWTNGLSTIWTDNKVAFKGGKLDVAPYGGIGLQATNKYVLLDTGNWEVRNIGGTNGAFDVALVGRECVATLGVAYKVSAAVLGYGKDAGISTPMTKGWCAVDFAEAPTGGMPVSLRLDYGASEKTRDDVKAFLEAAGYTSAYPSKSATGNFDLIVTVPVPAVAAGYFVFDFTDLSPEITVTGLRFREEIRGGTTVFVN